MRWEKVFILSVMSAAVMACTSVSQYEDVQTFKDCEACPPMLAVPAGSCVMGDNTGEGRQNEHPPQRIWVNQPLAISQSPITVNQFQAFVDATGYPTEAERNPTEGCWGLRDDISIGWLPGQGWSNNNLNQTGDHPVVCVSWNDAREYVQWLSAMTGFHYRLPSEAEWEYAARGGQQGQYFYGDDAAQVCEYINHADHQMVSAWSADTGVSSCDDGYLTTSPIGSFPANNFGLYDAYGNVWEWVADCYRPSLHKLDQKPHVVTASPCSEYTLRGASWASRPEGVTTSYRISSEPHMRTVDYGFRVARDMHHFEE